MPFYPNGSRVSYNTVDSLLAALVAAVNEQYPTDRTRPSVLTAYIEKDRQFYVSVVRYVDGTGDRSIITNARNSYLVTALEELSRSFLALSSAATKRDHLRSLVG